MKAIIDGIDRYSVSLYVFGVRFFKSLLTLIGIIWVLERYSHFRWILYIRSLFSIFDAADLVKLDLPWWSFGAIDHLERHLSSLSGKAVVFEWGSGASTAWLAKRSAKVYSLEHDIEWAKTTKNLITKYKNVKLITIPPDNTVDMFEAEYISNKPGHRGLSFKNYVDSINDIDAQFDLIAIDGRCKSACLKVAISKLKPGGIVLFDDSKRDRNQEALAASDLTLKRYKGMVPCLPYFTYETSVLMSKDSNSG
ncbi:MAG: putative O-methyltransferase YrrM [Chloroflexi bacterium]|nr:MAG: putative O-methyltransferase YrrM [Chloroflexota bacterium]